MPEDKKKKKDMWMWIAIGGTVLFVIAWFMCWIIVPAVPNEHCGGGGTSLSLAGGGSGTCSPCPDCGNPPCDFGQFYSEMQGKCTGCPYNSYYDTYYQRCTCNDGFVWNTTMERCDQIPTPEPELQQGCCPPGYVWDSRGMICESQNQVLDGTQTTSLLVGGICPDNAYYDTMNGYCMCFQGYNQNKINGCCVP